MANPIIEEYLASIKFLQFEGNSIARLIFWVFVFVTVWSTLRPRRTRNMFQRLVDSEPSAIPGVTIASVTLSLALFNLLFALQNGLDLVFIWGGARLPEALTLAEYAHRGAYPLIATALLAGLFILVTTHPKSAMAGNRLIRVLIILWIAQNIFLSPPLPSGRGCISRAIRSPGLRIAALLWMALVATGLVLVTWRMLRGNGLAWLVNGNVRPPLPCWGLCSFVDLGEIAARWNVRRAAEYGRRRDQSGSMLPQQSGWFGFAAARPS